MPLQETSVEFPFSGGLDEKTRAELVPQGMFAKLQNAVQLKHGAVGKAPGFALDVTGAGTAYRVFSTKDETLAIIDGSINNPPRGFYSYAPGGLGGWRPVGTAYGQNTIPPPAIVKSSFRFSTGGQTSALGASDTAAPTDMIVLDGYLIVLWFSSTHGVLGVGVYDATTGTLLYFSSTSAYGATTVKARLCSVGTTEVVLVWTDGTNVQATAMDTRGATLAFTGANPFLPIATASTYLDVMSGATQFYIAYVASGTTKATVKSFAAGNTTATHTVLTAATNVVGVALGGVDTGTVWLAYLVGTTVSVIGYDSTLSATATVASVMTGVDAASDLGITCLTNTSQGVVVSGNGASGMFWRPFDASAGAVRAGGANGYTTTTLANVYPQSRPFAPGGHPYIMVAYKPVAAADAQLTNVCIDLANPINDGSTSVLFNLGRPVATIYPRLSLANYTLLGLFPAWSSVYTTGNTVWTLNTQESTALSNVGEIVVLDFLSPYNYASTGYLDGMAMNGGTPAFYDGVSVFEQSFIVAPYISSATFSGTPGTNAFPNAGSWSWVAVYEWVDARGQLHQSQPSLPLVGVSGADHTTCTLVVSQCVLTSRTSAPSTILYRTTSPGTTYYRVGKATAGSYADTTTDTLVQANALLYTQPGTVGTALPRQCPPSLLSILSHADRLFGFEGQNVWYSGQTVVGEGPWWSDEFQFPVLAGIGPITGMASMDGSLLVFKRNRIFVVLGTGPADNGTGNDLSNPSQLSVDAGCIDPRSIVVTSAGCWFQSLRGLELLNRSLQLENFAGAAVEDTLTTYPVITSAIVNEKVGRIYWTARTSDASAPGAIVMYDLVHGVWSTRPSNSYGPKHAALLGTALGVTPTYAWLADAGNLYYETTTDYLDASSGSSIFAPTTIQTGPIKLSGIAGFQRVREIHLLGQANTRSNLTIAIDYDNAGTFAETHTFTAAQIAALSTSRVIVSVRPAQQKCRSIAVKITDATPSTGILSTGQGCTFIGLRFRIGVKPGSARIPAANQA